MGLMPTLSISQLTPDERLWRIDWFGECHYPSGRRNSQPSVRCICGGHCHGQRH